MFATEAFSVRSGGLARHDAQTQMQVHLEAFWWFSFWQPIRFGGTLSLLECGVGFAHVRWPWRWLFWYHSAGKRAHAAFAQLAHCGREIGARKHSGDRLCRYAPGCWWPPCRTDTYTRIVALGFRFAFRAVPHFGSTAASMLSRPGLCGVVAAVPFAQAASALRLSITGGGRRHRGGSP